MSDSLNPAAEVPLTDASAPFDDPTADVIIRTSDNVDFRVHKLMLSLSSPFFKDMFTLTQSPNTQCDPAEWKNGLPVVTVSEESPVIERLLKFCHPDEAPFLHTLEDVQTGLEAAKKYQMEGVKSRMGSTLNRTTFLESEPLRVFMIAYRYGLRGSATLAAEYTLRKPLIGDAVPELEHIPAIAYHRLLDYHQKCGVAASGSKSDPTYKWVSQGVWAQCNSCTPHDAVWIDGETNSPYTPRSWFADYMKAAEVALLARPHGDTVSDGTLIAPFLSRAIACSRCRDSAYLDLYNFIKGKFAKQIEEAILKIEVELKF